MYCNNCGVQNNDNAKFCVQCGQPVQNPTVAATGATLTTPMPSAIASAPGVPRTSGLAIGSLICGIFGIFFPAAIGAIIMGHISRAEISKSQGRVRGAGMALAGLILGYLFISIFPVLIIAAIAIPNLLRSRIAANEASAVGSVRTLVIAEDTYANTYEAIGYTCSLSQLGGEGGSPEHAGLIDNVLASGHKSGFTYELSGCEDETPHKKFTIVAYPRSPGQSGQRAFCADETGVIRTLRSGTGQECLESGVPLQ